MILDTTQIIITITGGIIGIIATSVTTTMAANAWSNRVATKADLSKISKETKEDLAQISRETKETLNEFSKILHAISEAITKLQVIEERVLHQGEQIKTISNLCSYRCNNKDYK